MLLLKIKLNLFLQLILQFVALLKVCLLIAQDEKCSNFCSCALLRYALQIYATMYTCGQKTDGVHVELYKFHSLPSEKVLKTMTRTPGTAGLPELTVVSLVIFFIFYYIILSMSPRTK